MEFMDVDEGQSGEAHYFVAEDVPGMMRDLTPEFDAADALDAQAAQTAHSLIPTETEVQQPGSLVMDIELTESQQLPEQPGSMNDPSQDTEAADSTVREHASILNIDVVESSRRTRVDPNMTLHYALHEASVNSQTEVETRGSELNETREAPQSDQEGAPDASSGDQEANTAEPQDTSPSRQSILPRSQSGDSPTRESLLPTLQTRLPSQSPARAPSLASQPQDQPAGASNTDELSSRDAASSVSAPLSFTAQEPVSQPSSDPPQPFVPAPPPDPRLLTPPLEDPSTPRSLPFQRLQEISTRSLDESIRQLTLERLMECYPTIAERTRTHEALKRALDQITRFWRKTALREFDAVYAERDVETKLAQLELLIEHAHARKAMPASERSAVDEPIFLDKLTPEQIVDSNLRKAKVAKLTELQAQLAETKQLNAKLQTDLVAESSRLDSRLDAARQNLEHLDSAATAVGELPSRAQLAEFLANVGVPS